MQIMSSADLKEHLLKKFSNEDSSLFLDKLLSKLSEDSLRELAEKFSDLNFEEKKKDIGFMCQEEENDYFASNPRIRTYCLECGDDFIWYNKGVIRNVSGYDTYGCKKCDS